MPQNENQLKKTTKKKAPRCPFINSKQEKCRKKLKLTDYPCRCGKKYCITHRLPEKHQCTVNYKEINKDTYFSGLGGGLYTKLEVI